MMRYINIVLIYFIDSYLYLKDSCLIKFELLILVEKYKKMIYLIEKMPFWMWILISMLIIMLIMVAISAVFYRFVNSSL